MNRLLAIALLLLAGCTPPRLDGANYLLPTGSLAGTTAIVAVTTRAAVQQRVRAGGLAMRHGDTANAAAAWYPAATPGGPRPCFIYLADDAAGFAALEHELWHCKLGDWHR